MTAEKAPDPRSGLDADGNWTPAFEGQRPPFEPGHELGKLGGRPPEHGAYSVLQLTPRAEAIAAWIRSHEHITPSDEAEVQRTALVLAKCERSAGILIEIDEALEPGVAIDLLLGRFERRASLSKDARGWFAEARRSLDGLGLTPTGRAQLEAASQPSGIPAHEAQAVLVAFFHAALEFVDRARRDEFMRRIDAVAGQVIGELPPAESIDTDAVEGQP